jgi:hypothetical protein
MEVSGQLHATVALAPGKNPNAHWIGDWVGTRLGLDAIKKRNILPLPGIEHLPSSSSLYRPSYPGCIECWDNISNQAIAASFHSLSYT